MNKEKIIKFIATNDHVSTVRTKPAPAATLIPRWYRDMPIYSGENNELVLNPAPTVTAKRCAPLLDSLTTGYIFSLWADILVTQQNGAPVIQWNTDQPVADVWPIGQSASVAIPVGFTNLFFKYLHGWVVSTPPGYSSLVTHPFGYTNLPVRSITGVVDTDVLKTEINVPFVIEDGFAGIIERGTPMFQVVPFKRDNWKSDFSELEGRENYLNFETLRTKISGYYSSLRATKRYN